MNLKSSVAIGLAIAGMGIGAGPAHSQLAGKGLIHPVNNFPVWFSDSKGVALQLCLDGNGTDGECFFDPPIAGNALSQATGFGAEAFWWAADAKIAMPSGNALLVLALEAAYGGGDPKPNDEFAFGRVRLRIDTPVAGQYKVWHPYLNEASGCLPEVFQAEAGGRAINITRDIGGGTPFDTMLKGEIGPFLTWDPAVAPQAPLGYVGSPLVEHPVVGGHCNINYFRVEAPVGVNLDGAGNNFVETKLFTVQGKILDEDNTPPAIEPSRATFLRSFNSSTGKFNASLNLWVNATPTATVQVTGLAQATANGPMTNDGTGSFYRRVPLNAVNSASLPPQVTIKATSTGGLTTTRKVDLTDTVDITSAVWKSGSLTVVATSSDKILTSVGPAPTLSLRLRGKSFPMVQTAAGRYAVTLTNMLVPPPGVAVTSSEGGSDTQQIAD